MRILGERVPGERRTYVVAVEEARRRMVEALEACLTPEQMERLEGVDLFKVKVGDLRAYPE